MTTTSDNKQHNNKGLVIDLNVADECTKEQSSIPCLPSGSSSSVNDYKTLAEQNGKQPSSPLKVVTNVDAPSHTSESPSTPSQHPSPTANGFRIPHPPRIKTTLDHGSRTSQLPSEATPKARRWSSFTQPPRRRSFPGSRKDGFEYIYALRAEAKLAREKGQSTAIFNQPGPSSKRRKRSMSGMPSGNNGYLAVKHNVSSASDVRTRSSTASGAIPHAVRAPLLRGSHIVSGSSNMSSRLEHIKRESTRSNLADNLPTTLWDYLMLEMETKEIKGVEEYKKERLYNFLRIPESLEKVSSSMIQMLTLVNLVWMDCLS